jgi:glucose/arabinose dehydrogenase
MNILFKRSTIRRKTAFSRQICLTLVAAGSALAGQPDPNKVVKSQEADFRVETVADGLEAPWGMVKLPDGRFLVTERPGRVRIIENGKLLDAPVEGLPEIRAGGQGGLLDIRLHPDYAKNGWIYLAFSKPFPKGALTSIIRGKLKGNKFTDVETVFDPPADEASSGGNHFGCRIVFDGKGHMFFSIGDRGDVTNPSNQAQRTDNVKGKVHRLNDDGSIPKDNPFAGKSGASPSIWSYGNRNAQGLAIQPGTGLLWETEHGPRGGDELNIIRKGENYGWPVVTYGINYSGSNISEKTSAPGMTDPVLQWTPSPAVAGMEFYTGDAFPKWKGNLFVSALAHTKIFRLTLDGEKVAKQEELLGGSGRVRDVRVFDDGYLYVIYDGPGKIVRLVPAN